jgi:hypothetical protein
MCQSSCIAHIYLHITEYVWRNSRNPKSGHSSFRSTFELGTSLMTIRLIIPLESVCSVFYVSTITAIMHQSPSLQDVGHSYSQEFPRHLCNPEIHYFTHLNPQLDCIKSQLNSFCILTSCYLNVRFISTGVLISP